MEFKCFTNWENLPTDAEALFSSGEKDSLFFSRCWFENLSTNALDEDQNLLLACVVDGDSVLAILPLRTQHDGSWHALSTYYTSLFTVLLSQGNRREILDCMAEGLSFLSFKSLRIEPVSQQDTDLCLLQHSMETRGFSCHRYFRFINWSHRIREPSFEAYMAERPSRLRNTISRKRRKLQREYEYEIRLYTDQHLEQAVEDYNIVYKASWKDGERFTGFVPALITLMARSGWLRLAILYLDGQPVAGQIWFVVHGKASIFRLVYDEAWQRYSPGSILTAFLMEYVIETDRVKSIDFLTGNEAYKQDWMSDRRERWGLLLVRTATPKVKLFTRLHQRFRRLRSG